MTIAASRARPSWAKPSVWSWLTPPRSAVAPEGRPSPSRASMISALTAPRSESLGLADTVVLVTPSMRVSSGGCWTSTTSATSASSINRPVGVAIGSSSSSATVCGASWTRTTTSRRMSSMVAVPTFWPLKAAATVWPTAASLNPCSTASSPSTCTSREGCDSEMPLVTSSAPSMARSSSSTSSAASARVAWSSAVTRTSIPEPPIPPMESRRGSCSVSRSAKVSRRTSRLRSWSVSGSAVIV